MGLIVSWRLKNRGSVSLKIDQQKLSNLNNTDKSILKYKKNLSEDSLNDTNGLTYAIVGREEKRENRTGKYLKK